MNHQHAILHLSLIDGVGPITLHHIIAQCNVKKIAWHEIYTLHPADWIALGIPSSRAHHIYQHLQNRDVLDREVSRMQQHAISLITILDAAYPQRLRSLYTPPPLLYYKGVLSPSEKRHLAFVGSRQANRYGKQIIEQLIPELVAHDFTIVSGGALGADSMAHQATIDAGGTTIVILGSGLLRPYPYQHKKLFADTIATGGAVVSTFALQTAPLPGNFIARNRVIAGLADGVVVVQAAQKSGTRSTAQYALEQGRDVFAVPGVFDDPLSAGCHALIQEGATLITNAQDILQNYDIHYLQKSESSLQSLRLPQNNTLSIKERIIALCVQPQSIDDIVAKTSKSLSEVQHLLFEMHMAGVLEQDISGLWRTV